MCHGCVVLLVLLFEGSLFLRIMGNERGDGSPVSNNLID